MIKKQAGCFLSVIPDFWAPGAKTCVKTLTARKAGKYIKYLKNNMILRRNKIGAAFAPLATGQ